MSRVQQAYKKQMSFSHVVLVCLSLTGILMAQNAIDAVTSSSTRFKIISGKAYSTYAVIEWWDYYANGNTHDLKWGKTDAYGSSMNLLPFTRQTNQIDTIKQLDPDTKYYAASHRVYTRKNADITTKFEFTTPKSTSIVPQLKPAVSSVLPPNAKVALYTITGQKIATLSTMEKVTAAAAFSGKVVPGLYIARVMGQANRPMRSFQIMVGE